MSRQASAVADRPVRVDFRNRDSDSAIVFVHGFGGHAQETWGDFPRYLMDRTELDGWDAFGIGYASSLRIELARVWTAGAPLDVLGYYLRTSLALPPLQRYQRIALVAHSMGGLIAQQAMLDNTCRQRISHLILFGTPSAGIGKANLLRSFNRQAQDMSTGSEFITKLREAWNATYADGTLTLRVVAGERDAFVPTASSLEPFPESLRFVVPGDHLTMVKPHDAGSLSVELVVQTLTTCKSSATSPKNNLPRQLSRFIGREKEIVEIQALLDNSQLVTIVGAGGIGKTRTALEAASGLLDDRFDGIWFVDLAPLSDAALVPSAIASALGIQDIGASRDLIDTIAMALQGKTALIVLDNCEHVVTASADAAERLVRACPSARFLVTSREALGVSGEKTFRMPSLGVSEGAALFVDRAKAADSSFALSDAHLETIDEIVRRLDGIALAIELAAPRVKVLGLQQLAQRLDQRLELLAGGSRTAMPRQQTLRALIAWSYDLLNDAERALLAQLAVFRGSFTLDAVANVCEAPPNDRARWDELTLLASLIDKSLVATETGDDLRYRLLESTREYALERLEELGKSEDALRRHCAYFTEMSARAYEAVWSTSLQLWVGTVRSDLENYRAAIEWGLLAEHDILGGASIVANLVRFWEQALSSEGRRLLERADVTTVACAPPVLRGRIQLGIAMLASQDAPVPERCAVALETLAGTGDEVSYADALLEQMRNVGRAGDVDKAIPIGERAVGLSRSLQRPHLTARILATLGLWYGLVGRRDEGLTALDEAASTLRALSDRRRLIIALANIAELKFAYGDVDGAVTDGSEGVAISSAMGDENDLVALFRANLAAYLLGANEPAKAWFHARAALDVALRVGSRRTVNIALQHLACVAATTGNPERAARIIGHVNAMFAAVKMLREPTERIGYERIMTALGDQLGSDHLQSLSAQGAACDESLIIAEAMAIPEPGTCDAMRLGGGGY